MAKVDTLVLDKTGTLTVGKPEVVKEHIYEEFDKNILYSFVKNSNHPISRGIMQYVDATNEIIFDEYTQVPASGIIAKYNNKIIFGGNKKLLEDNEIDIDFISQNSVFYFVIDKRVVAVYELKDKVKENAEVLVADLERKGIKSIMLTGDNGDIAKKVADEVGIKEYYFSQSPQDKSEFINKLKKDNKTIVMVGDGVNDVLALAHADISIVMGSGSDIAVDVSDVVLLNDSLRSLSDAFKISRTTFGLIKQNLGISLVYNAVTIPLAMAGYVIPLVAAISMSVSSLLVVGNSMRIRYKWNRS